jgi:long-subunit fatty acid transport protein
MKYCNSSFIIIFSLILFAAGTAYSQNVNDALRVGLPGLGANARALGMGNSYISLSDDASAAFFNPAGFGLLKRLEFSGGISYVNYNNSVDFMNQTSDYSNSNTSLNRLSFAFPVPTLRGSLVFGLSYHQTNDFTGGLEFDGLNNGNNSLIQNFLNTDIPFDLYLTDDDNNTPINGRLNQSGDILTMGTTNNWTFSGAVEVSRNVYVGANLNIISGSFESDNDFYEDDTRNLYEGETAAGEPRTVDFRRFYLNRVIDWDISGWDAKVGIIYELDYGARIGATIQFPKFHFIKEKFLVDGRSEFGTGEIFYLDNDKYSDEVEYDIVTPFSFAGGFSINLAGLIFSAEATLTDHSQLEFRNPNGLTEQYVNTQNKNIKDLLGPTINYNVGLEYTVPLIDIRLRGGFLVQPSPFKDDPTEFNRKYFTGGIGFLTNQTIGIDLGYAHGWWSTFGDNYGDNVSRTFQDISVNHFLITATYRF